MNLVYLSNDENKGGIGMFKTDQGIVKLTKKSQLGNYRDYLTLLVLSLFFSLMMTSVHAQTIEMVRYFDTWQGSPQIKSTDPAGIGYHAPSGNLYIVDSEINEIPAIFTGDNIFEVSKSGDAVIREISSGNNEPTGITYSEYDGYFYVTNDNTKLVTRYDSNFNIVAQIITTATDTAAKDPEGITSDPSTGDLYVVDGSGGSRRVLIYNSSLSFVDSFSVSAAVPGVDPDGIAFHPDNNTLFIINGRYIYQFTTSGALLESFDIGGFSPAPIAAQGLTFAPTSDPNDDPDNLALYIADAMVDNDADPNERDGRIYETVISIADFVAAPQLIPAGSEVSFTNLSPTYITSYSWDFGDGETSTVRDPSHTYDNGGVYTVSLTVSGPTGTDTETKTDYITVADTSVSFQDGVNGYDGTRDTWLNLNILNQNNGNDIQLQVDGMGPNKSALLFWDLTSIPIGSTIYTVDIIVNVTDASGADYEIYDLKRAWVEDEATWQIYASGQAWEVAGADGSGDRGSTALGAIIGSLGADTTSLNAAGVAMVQSWVDDPSSNHGFIVQDYINHTNGLKFSSREATTVTERPMLRVVYTPPPQILVEAKVFLEGPYDASGDTMRTDLQADGVIPNTSPYADARSVSAVPDNAVDWVFLELRETAAGPTVDSISVFVANHGRIIADDGITEQIAMDAPEGNYYIIVKHRNHISVMSAGSILLSSDSATLYDFTSGSSQFYGSSAKQIETGVFGMYTGDANGNGQIQNDDKNVDWATQVGEAGYRGADFNLNGQVQNDDKNVYWNANVGAGTQVP